MKINIIRGILIVLLVCTFSIIFNFSSQDSDESGSISGKITQVVTNNIESIQKMEKSEKVQVLKKVEKVIRKIAHFSIYTVVGVLLMSLFSTYHLSQKQRIIVSLIIGFIYASSDEFHQSFVPGRSPQITDVFIDTFGVLFGICILILVIKNITKFSKSSNISKKSASLLSFK